MQSAPGIPSIHQPYKVAFAQKDTIELINYANDFQEHLPAAQKDSITTYKASLAKNVHPTAKSVIRMTVLNVWEVIN